MPDISQCSTGRKIIMKSGSPEGSANSSYISRSKMTGRMLYFMGKRGEIDTDVDSLYPNGNWWGEGQSVLARRWDSNPTDVVIARTLYKGPKNRIMHIYMWKNPNGINEYVSIYEVDPDSFNIKTVTWNTQPSLGNLIDTKFVSGIGWYEFKTGSIGAFVMRLVDETTPTTYGSRIYFYFYSSNYSDKNYRPYFTNE